MGFMRLLIVDDEPATVDMIGTFMEINGYEWSGAYNGQDGLSLLFASPPDAVILDLMMPDIEGFEFCERMRQQEAFSRTPVLIVSARTDSEAIEQAFAAGANAYLTKPFNLVELVSEVQRLVSG